MVIEGTLFSHIQRPPVSGSALCMDKILFSGARLLLSARAGFRLPW